MFLYRLIARGYNKNIEATGLGLFRIAYATVVLLEVLQIIYFRTIIFQPLTLYTTPALFIWTGAVVGIILGFFTRTCSVANYAFTVIFIGTFVDYEYHFDFTMIGTNFLLMFLPISRVLSLDNLLRRDHRTEHQTDFNRTQQVSSLAYTIPVFVGVGLVYFDSVFAKSMSDSWIQGLGVWIPASLPHLTWNDFTPILDHYWLILVVGYSTILFEGLFIFAFWFRKLRVPFLIAGLGLHLGILFTFPIPLFALGYMAFYILLVPVSWWRYFSHDSRVPGLDTPIVTEGSWRQRFEIVVIMTYLLIIALFALATLYHSPIIETLRRDFQLDQGRLGKAIVRGTRTMTNFSRHYLGITPHGVFLDGHYRGYRHIVALTHLEEDGSETWLPIIQEDSHVHWLNSGRVWAKWSFRVNSPRMNELQLVRGIRDFTGFWLAKNNKGLENAVFRVKLKEIEIPTKWKEGFLRTQKNKPWRHVATVRWNDGKFHPR